MFRNIFLFFTLPNWFPAIFTCVVLFFGSGAVMAQYSDEPISESKSKKWDIPSLNATVKWLRFYESGSNGVPYKQRVYMKRFPKSQARYINWDLHLTHPAPGRRIDFPIDAVFFNTDGNVMGEQTLKTYINANWKRSNHSLGRGWKVPGKWPPGNYRVELSIAGKKIATGFFDIEEKPSGDLDHPDDLGEL